MPALQRHLCTEGKICPGTMVEVGITHADLVDFAPGRNTSVMIEKFGGVLGMGLSEFLDLNHTSKSMILVSLAIAQFARDAGGEVWRTAQSGH